MSCCTYQHISIHGGPFSATFFFHPNVNSRPNKNIQTKQKHLVICHSTPWPHPKSLTKINDKQNITERLIMQMRSWNRLCSLMLKIVLLVSELFDRTVYRCELRCASEVSYLCWRPTLFCTCCESTRHCQTISHNRAAHLNTNCPISDVFLVLARLVIDQHDDGRSLWIHLFKLQQPREQNWDCFRRPL